MRFELIFILLLMTSVSAISVCIDNDNPSAPAYLEITVSGTGVVLVWPGAVDEPNCSGIDYYNITRNGNWIGQVEGDVLTFSNKNVSYGTYDYTVFAVDLVGHNSGSAIKNNIILSKPGNGGGTSGGSSSYSYVCVEDWECGEWSECVGNDMRRLCNDLNECGPENDKPETYRECGEDDVNVENWIGESANVSQPEGFFSLMTGVVIGGGVTSFAVAGAFILLALGAFGFVRFRKKD